MVFCIACIDPKRTSTVRPINTMSNPPSTSATSATAQAATTTFATSATANVSRRTSRLNHQQRLIYLQDGQTQKFCNNSIHTAKYNVITFFPKFFFEQFRKYANVFFLIIVLLQQIDNVSPTGRYTTAVPFILILTVSALKELFEDVKRHRADRKVNRTLARVLNRSARQFEDRRWCEVQVGDIVQCKQGDYFPADLLLLSSSEPSGLCYVETASLDGETNLKIRQSLHCTYELRLPGNLIERLQFAQIDCEPPNGHLYEFNGNFKLDGQLHVITPNQILLRGAKLKNTRWAIGTVLYTGHESKLMLNSMQKAPLKQSALEKFTNSHMIYLLGILLLMGFVSTVFSVFHNRSYDAWYLHGFADLSASFGFTFLTFVILYNNLIPISLQVSLEIVRFIQALFINWDVKMYCDESDTPAVARTSNLNEELGQVSYILSDKTGTLTRNVMEFKQCSIAGRVYDEMRVADIGKVIQAREEDWRTHHEFLQALSVCHTVVPEVQDETDRVPTSMSISSGEKRSNETKPAKKIVYQAASPDEGALVSGAADMGFEFTARTPQKVHVQALGRPLEFDLLHVIEFDSTRKRMSVIVRDLNDQNRIKIYCKGADSVIYERLSKQKTYAQTTLLHLEHFATLGLRTLCIAYKELTPEHYQDWLTRYQAALATVPSERDKAVEAATDLIEQDLQLLGASAIEDKLQDGVPEAIETFLSAGIRFWILTGDKQETAINIGHSCRLLQSGQTMLLVSESGSEDDVRRSLESAHQTIRQVFGSGIFRPGMQDDEVNRAQTTGSVRPTSPMDIEAKHESSNHLRSNGSKRSSSSDSGSDDASARARCSLVVDGAALKFALRPSLHHLFLEVALRCHSVICCRVSPKQKADIVDLVKNQKLTGQREITLAIGDGANDVAMIRSAHVGIGISGKEGLQAANSADYSIGQFRFLVRLLLVHGSFSLTRLSKLILYSFYKNIALYVIEMWFAALSAWSGQTIFERWTIGLYNVLFTMAPPLAIGLFERPCDESHIFRRPKLYSQLATELQSGPMFWRWVADALLHSIILFYMTLGLIYNDALWSSGLADGGYLVFGNMLYTYVVVTVCLKAGLECHCWTFPLQLAIWGSIGGWFAFLVIYSRVWPTLPMASEMRGIATMVFSTPVFWTGLVLIPLTTLLPDITWKTVHRSIWPSYLDRVIQASKRTQFRAETSSPTDSLSGITPSASDSLITRWLTIWRDFCGWSAIGSQSGTLNAGARLRRRRSSGLLINTGNASIDGQPLSQQPPPSLATTSHDARPGDGSPLHFVAALNLTKRPVPTAAPDAAVRRVSRTNLPAGLLRRPSLTPNDQLQDELRYGFAFSQDEHGAVSQSQLIGAYDSTGQAKRNQ